MAGGVGAPLPTNYLTYPLYHLHQLHQLGVQLVHWLGWGVDCNLMDIFNPASSGCFPTSLLWCNTHNRRVYSLGEDACFKAGIYKGGIMIPCQVVELTGICDMVDEVEEVVQQVQLGGDPPGGTKSASLGTKTATANGVAKAKLYW